MVSETTMEMNININPITSRTVSLSPKNNTENNTPNTDSKLRIKEADEGGVYFWPTFCNNSAAAVAKQTKYKIPIIEPAWIFDILGAVSKRRVTNKEKMAAKPNCKIVKRIASLPWVSLATATICIAKKKPPSRVSKSPVPIVRFCVNDTNPIPAKQSKAARKLYRSGRVWLTNQYRNGTTTQ